jgi:precorrin-8X/cobalt-precorrin-8 methylmutase
VSPHPIEVRSYAILRSRVDLGALPPLRRAVTERVIHASADLAYATDLVTDEEHLRGGLRALRAGAPIVTDTAMVAAGITARRSRSAEKTSANPPPARGGDPTSIVQPSPAPGEGERDPVDNPTTLAGPVCSIGRPEAARLAEEAGITRSAAAVRLSLAEVGHGAVWVVGCAPTALAEIVASDVAPALVIGLPVGFVGAVEAKEALRESGLPAVSNVSEKGGSAVAAAALNALLYHGSDT